MRILHFLKRPRKRERSSVLVVKVMIVKEVSIGGGRRRRWEDAMTDSERERITS